ncbi:MAG: hypothetical protein PHF84_01745 [bacterium]|nr:hypothetical protein [bacterium]
MKKIKSALLIVVLAVPMLLTGEIIQLIDVPTAFTILRGYYDIGFVTYPGGGIQTKISIGLTDRIMLGIIEDIDGAIGNDRAKWSIPGVLAKINIVYPDPESMGLALGYDVLSSGLYSKAYNNELTDDLVYGFYMVASKSVMLFKGDQYLHFGVRFPILPNEARVKGKNISFYTGLNVIINPELMLIGEIENIYLNASRGKEVLYNLGLKYSFSESLSIGAIFQYTKSKELNSTDKVSRSLSIEYQNIFY